jgi:hypothetical protein
VLIVSFITSVAACATTKLGKIEKPVDQAAQFEKAKMAFNQQNYDRAALLLKPLAEQGHADAQYALGYLYYNGLGVPSNNTLSMQWLKRAAANGNNEAVEALRRLSLLGRDSANIDEQTTSLSTQTPVEANEAVMGASKETYVTETPKPITPDSPGVPAEAVLQTESAEAAEAMAPAITSAARTTFTDDEQWIMNQSSDHYTIQVIATSNEAALQRFINENNLQDSTVYYRTRRNGGNWFVLIQGSFKSLSLAKNAINKLATPLQLEKPWIKPIADIQKALADR